MPQAPLDLSRVFTLEPHGPETFVGVSPAYSWGRVYGGLVVAQALWAAMQTVRPEHAVHSLHAYFILGGEIGEPIRYEVDRVRNGRSFSTRRVIARQSGGAILTLACSFQVAEDGPEVQSAVFPADTPRPETLTLDYDAGCERCDVPAEPPPPRSRVWARWPAPLGEDPRLHACALAYVSDMNAMGAVGAAYPGAPRDDATWDAVMMGASLDHALWFHRPVRADDWLLIDLTGHGLVHNRGLATGPVFGIDGTHAATIAQEGLLRDRRRRDASRRA